MFDKPVLLSLVASSHSDTGELSLQDKFLSSISLPHHCLGDKLLVE